MIGSIGDVGALPSLATAASPTPPLVSRTSTSRSNRVVSPSKRIVSASNFAASVALLSALLTRALMPRSCAFASALAAWRRALRSNQPLRQWPRSASACRSPEETTTHLLRIYFFDNTRRQRAPLARERVRLGGSCTSIVLSRCERSRATTASLVLLQRGEVSHLQSSTHPTGRPSAAPPRSHARSLTNQP